MLDGSCRTPIAALAELDGDRLRLRGLVASPDGRVVERIETEGTAASDASALEAQAGAAIRARLGAGLLRGRAGPSRLASCSCW